MSADRIGVAMKGRRSGGGWLVCCPVPSHGKGRGDRSPSLSVHDGDDGKLLLRCFAGCEFLDILDELRGRGLVDDLPKLGRVLRAVRVVPNDAEHKPDAAALHIIDECETPHGTIVQEYLERRGLPDLPKSILFHRPSLAMITVVQRPDGLTVALQSKFLTPDALKAPVKPKTTGKLYGGAVRLGPAAETMGLAEGVETALSAQIMTGIPIWASLGASRLGSVELPEMVREVHLFADNDQPGLAEAKKAAEVHQRDGRRVLIRTPPDQFEDYNDFLIALADFDGDGDRLIVSLPADGSAAA